MKRAGNSDEKSSDRERTDGSGARGGSSPFGCAAQLVGHDEASQDRQVAAAAGTQVIIVTEEQLRNVIVDMVDDVMARAAGIPVCPPVQPLLTREQIASVLSVTPRQVDRLCQKGLPFVRVGAHRRFDAVDVLRWLRSGQLDTPQP